MRKYLMSYLLYALIAILVVVLYLGDFGGLKKLQWKLDDLMYSLRGEGTPTSDIVLVTIDDGTVQKLGDWPWSFDVLADLIAACNTGGPKAILVDLDLTARVSEDTTQNTTILANQISWSDNIVLPYDIAREEYPTNRVSKPEYLWANSMQADYNNDIMGEKIALKVRKPFLPSGVICQYADGLGFAYIEYDQDHKVRWAPLAAAHDGYLYPSAPLLTAALYLGSKPEEITLKEGGQIAFGSYTIPVDPSARVFINYNSPEATFTQYSASRILEDRATLANLKGKLVIIGLTATQGAEFYATPVTARMPRSAISANVIENIIHHNHIQILNLPVLTNVLIIIGLGVLCALLLPRIQVLYRVVSLVVFAFILANITFILFNNYQMLTRPLYIGLELLLFMAATPLLDQGRFAQSLGPGGPVPMKKNRKERDLHQRNIPVREIKAAGNASEFQETEVMNASPSSRPTSSPASSSGATMPPTDLEASPTKMTAAGSSPVMTISEPSATNAGHLASQTPSASPSMSSSGDMDRVTHLGRYQVLEVLGKGAMGTVFKGVDPAINRLVALKTIRLDFVSDEAEMAELRDRLLREAQAAGKLSHPNIVTIYDAGSEGTLQYIAMEYLEGQTLEQLIKKHVQFSYRIIANIITQICNALEYAHSQGIVHRDIKPANIMVLPDYSVRVMDFGIARIDTSSMTRTGIAMGTPNYIAPELLQGKEVDRRCDIFSLGVVVYEMLTGRRPFRGENLTALVYSIVNDDPPPPSSLNENMPLIFDHITAKALAKNPVDRYQKASELRLALADFMGSFATAKR